jgi:hypothetical protein
MLRFPLRSAALCTATIWLTRNLTFNSFTRRQSPASGSAFGLRLEDRWG